VTLAAAVMDQSLIGNHTRLCTSCAR